MRGWMDWTGWTALVLACSLLSGCASSPGASADAPAGPAVVTDPRDLSYLQNGTPGSHVHDYWDGRTQVTLVDETADIALTSYGGDHGPIGWFTPPDGTVVLQGTGRIEVTVSWEDAEQDAVGQTVGQGNAYTRLELWVKRANEEEAFPVGPLEKGVPLAFNSTNEQADPPHYTLSLWEFRVVFWNDGADEVRFSGSITMKAEGFRTLPLVLFPPHLDRWNGTTQIVLREFTSTAEETHLVLTYACTNGCLPWFGPDGDLVVPYDAREVQVTFTPSAQSTPVPVVLDYHGADSRSHATVAGQALAGGTLLFSIVLEPGQADSPYAFQSLWDFRVRLDTPMEQGAWKGEYHVKAVALR